MTGHMKEEWLFQNAFVPVDVETTAALVTEIKRLIDVVGGMVLAQPEQERLIRIMGTFDLATGHADTFDELLDSLESELRDVLGHYRAAVEEHLTQEPVAWGVFDGPNLHDMFFTREEAQDMVRLKGDGSTVAPLYTAPPQRPWQGLADEEVTKILEMGLGVRASIETALDKIEKKNG